MFGKKQDLAKELEEKLNNAQSQLKILQTQIEGIKNDIQQIVPFFESQIIAQSEMDKDLTRAAGRAHDTIEESKKSMEVLEQLAMELTSLRGQLEDEEKDKRRMQEAVKKQREQMDAAVEEGRKLNEPVKALRQVQKGLLEDVENMHGGLEQMLDYAKQMTVASLNCAIEAGRMGDVGRKFIAAAEEVRLLSGAYERAAAAAVQQTDSMEAYIRQLEEQTASMVKSNKSYDAAVRHLEKSAAEQEAVCKRAAQRRHLEKAALIADSLKDISQSHDKIDALQHQALSDIEHLGESFISEQEARKGLEQVFDQIGKACAAKSDLEAYS